MRKYIEIPYKDGVLRGFHDDANSDKLAIITHGIGGNKLGHKFIFKQFADFSVQNNISVLRLDFWGTGESDGDFADTIHSRQAEELTIIVNYATEILGYENIFLCSTTIGCYSVWHCQKNDDVKAIVNWNPITDFERYEQYAKKGMNPDKSIDMKGLYTKPSYIKDLENLKREIPTQNVPVKLIQGTLDGQYKTGNAKKIAKQQKWDYEEIKEGNHLWEGNEVRELLFKKTIAFIKNTK